MKLGSEWGGGTPNRLFLSLGNNPGVYGTERPGYKLADSPSAGRTLPYDVRLDDAFGTAQVTARDIDFVRVVNYWDNGAVSSNQFRLQSMLLPDPNGLGPLKSKRLNCLRRQHARDVRQVKRTPYIPPNGE